MSEGLAPLRTERLVDELRALIAQSRSRAAQSIKSEVLAVAADAKRPTAVIEETLSNLEADGRIFPDLVFRNPYVLDFLGMPADFNEPDREATILREIEKFLLDLDSRFCLVARQKRLPIGPEDHYLDLLFFHRSLRALVAIELKLGRFDAGDKGQMELYLRWLDKYERQTGENPPLGLILCADQNQAQIELLELNDDGSIRAASYPTELPPRELLERKLLESIEHAQSLTKPHDGKAEEP